MVTAIPVREIEVNDRNLSFTSALLTIDGKAGAWNIDIGSIAKYGQVKPGTPHTLRIVANDGRVFAGQAQLTDLTGRLVKLMTFVGLGELRERQSRHP